MAWHMRRRSPEVAVVLVPALIAAALCACELTTRSLWLDEGASLTIAAQHGAALWRGIAHDGGNMLVYYLALHELIAAFGHGLVTLRILSVIADAATAGLTAALALKLFSSRPVALVAGTLVGVSVGLVFWGQDARGYAWMVTATAGAFLCLLALLEEDRHRLWPPLVGYVLFTTLALYIGYDAVLVIPAQLLTCVLLRRRLGVLLAGLVVVVGLSVPLLVLASDRGSGQLFWVPGISWNGVAQALETLVSSGLPPNIHTTAVTVVGGVIGVLVALVALGGAWSARLGPGRAELITLPTLWLAVPLVLAIILYAAGEPVELARITILAMPALALLVGWLTVGPREAPVAARREQIVACAPRLGGAGGWPLLAGLVLIVVLGLRVWALVPSYFETPEPWKAVAAEVLAAARPGDCAAFYPLDGRSAFGYYIDTTAGGAARAPRSVLPRQPWDVLEPHVEQYPVLSRSALAARTRGCARVWLIASHEGQPDGPPQSRRNWAGYLATESALSRLYPHSVTTRHGWASTIRVGLYTR